MILLTRKVHDDRLVEVRFVNAGLPNNYPAYAEKERKTPIACDSMQKQITVFQERYTRLK
jgi:hypothetical protein